MRPSGPPRAVVETAGANGDGACVREGERERQGGVESERERAASAAPSTALASTRVTAIATPSAADDAGGTQRSGTHAGEAKTSCETRARAAGRGRVCALSLIHI
eukprot:5430691-Pleurochrysis_carterae.AAC.2